MPDKSHLIIVIINTQGQNGCLSLSLDYKKADLPFLNKIPNSKEQQSEQVQIRTIFGIEMVSSGILRFSLAKQRYLPYLPPIRVANAFAALAFLVWPIRRCDLQRAVCHKAARIDNNKLSLQLIHGLT